VSAAQWAFRGLRVEKGRSCTLASPQLPDRLMRFNHIISSSATPCPTLFLSFPALFSSARRYALTGKEVKMILMQRLVKVDGKYRTDTTYPAGFMDVITLEKTDDHFR
jgi:hypothetical protein